MGRKKRKVNIELKPFCYYCDREFDDEKILIQHQKAKHFKCLQCNRKLDIANGLVVHMLQVHKTNLKVVPNALPKRNDPEIIIRGMNGVPPEIIEENLNKLKQKLGDKDIKRQQRVNWAQVAMAPTMEQFLQQAQTGNFTFPGFNSPILPPHNLLSNSTDLKKKNMSSAPLYLPNNNLNMMQPPLSTNLYSSNNQQNLTIPNIPFHVSSNIPPNNMNSSTPTGIPSNIPPPTPPNISHKYPQNIHLSGSFMPPNLPTNIPQTHPICIPPGISPPIPPSTPPTTPSAIPPVIPSSVHLSVPPSAPPTMPPSVLPTIPSVMPPTGPPPNETSIISTNLSSNAQTGKGTTIPGININNNVNKTNGIQHNNPPNEGINHHIMNNINSSSMNNMQTSKQSSLEMSPNNYDIHTNSNDTQKNETNNSTKEINGTINNNSKIEEKDKTNIEGENKIQKSKDKENTDSEYLYDNSISTTIKLSIPPPNPPSIPPTGDLKLNYSETVIFFFFF
ncbi:zinc finger protein, putative [Plasmodium gallinaceum]|uniref:Zinc finger protein, putative n=1 Tax=Plasmodium gallinaceum TaxID=5849 RepID=A0A1J1GS66_PLAGA|nr:zinc finger protein, putative [Plasmodium gallinaceum]CRG94152.1 zinc finger protein, putative [Plasmodium gallinaceum]